MKTIYDVTYFIKKLSAIPEHLWCINEQFDSNGRSCAFGHCNQDRKYSHPEYIALLELSNLANELLTLTFIGKSSWRNNGYIPNVNNGFIAEYQQATPKERTLAVLHDIKAKQQPAPEVVERIVYVSFDATVKELSGQLTNN